VAFLPPGAPGLRAIHSLLSANSKKDFTVLMFLAASWDSPAKNCETRGRRTAPLIDHHVAFLGEWALSFFMMIAYFFWV